MAIERTPPQNMDAERSVLGAVLLNNEVLLDVAMRSMIGVNRSERILNAVHRYAYMINHSRLHHGLHPLVPSMARLLHDIHVSITITNYETLRFSKISKVMRQRL